MYTISNLTVDAIVYFIIVLLVVGFPMVAPPRPVAPHVNPAFFPDMQSGTTSVVRRIWLSDVCELYTGLNKYAQIIVFFVYDYSSPFPLLVI